MIKIPFKTGLTIQRIGSIRPSDWLRIAKALELEHLEFDLTVFDDIDNVLEVGRTGQTAIHSPYIEDYGIDLSTDKPAVRSFIDNVNEYRKVMNIKYVVVHPPNDPDGSLEMFLNNLNALNSFILLENMPWQSWKDFEAIFSVVRDYKANNIGFCFDIPHSFVTHGENFLELPINLLEMVKSYDGYIHISGGLKNADTHLPLVTDGDIPFNRVRSFLKSFKGSVTMELKPRNIEEIDKIIQSYKIMLGISGKKWLFLKTSAKERMVMKKIRALAAKHAVSSLDRTV
ncbi:MAG: sugar phosphate isomerase/epimerase family protein [Candidatus Odinarchaeota archaeon]